MFVCHHIYVYNLGNLDVVLLYRITMSLVLTAYFKLTSYVARLGISDGTSVTVLMFHLSLTCFGNITEYRIPQR